MTNRAQDWLAQGLHDLEHARHARDAGDHDWACFAAQQAAEKATKGLILHLQGEGWGHSVLRLLRDLESRIAVPDALFDAARRLDRHYIPTRYANGFDSGSPKDYYLGEDSQRAIEDAGRVCQWSEDAIRRP